MNKAEAIQSFINMANLCQSKGLLTREDVVLSFQIQNYLIQNLPEDKVEQKPEETKK